MAIIPVNLARVSNNLRTFNLLQTSRSTQLNLFRAQNQIATGLRFQTASEDPVSASQVLTLDQHMSNLTRAQSNLGRINSTLTTVEAAMQESIDLLTEAKNLTLESIGDNSSTTERQSLMTVVDRILEQMISVGNRQHLGQYLFAGDSGRQPFVWGAAGIEYRGDLGQAEGIVDANFNQDSFTVSGASFFRGISPAVRGVVDLDPRVTPETRISDLRGATGQGVQLGTVVLVEDGQQFSIDLTGAETVGDVLDRLNAQMPDTLVATTDGYGIQIGYSGTATPTFTLSDITGGTTARDLGIHTNGGSGPQPAADLDPVLTHLTKLADLRTNVMASLPDGLRITNGDRTVEVDLSTAETTQDLLNAINATGLGVLARISDDGRTIEVRNRVSGSDLRIEELGGSLAGVLGIRSMQPGTPLSELNDGRGVGTVDGPDIRITTANGMSFDVDLDGAATLNDVIDALNSAGGGAITASLSPTGGGLRITDNTFGVGTLIAERLNVSPALSDLGLDVAAVGNTLTGRDVNPVRVDGPFTALLELRQGLQNDDRRLMEQAGERIERVLEQMRLIQGQTASQAKKLDDQAQRVENELSAAQILQSELRDADLTDVITRFQQLQTALQANYAAASRIMDLNLLNYLR
jgi:flagellin-like hook-associated protein FlgL